MGLTKKNAQAKSIKLDDRLAEEIKGIPASINNQIDEIRTLLNTNISQELAKAKGDNFNILKSQQMLEKQKTLLINDFIQELNSKLDNIINDPELGGLAHKFKEELLGDAKKEVSASDYVKVLEMLNNTQYEHLATKLMIDNNPIQQRLNEIKSELRELEGSKQQLQSKINKLASFNSDGGNKALKTKLKACNDGTRAHELIAEKIITHIVNNKDMSTFKDVAAAQKYYHGQLKAAANQIGIKWSDKKITRKIDDFIIEQFNLVKKKQNTPAQQQRAPDPSAPPPSLKPPRSYPPPPSQVLPSVAPPVVAPLATTISGDKLWDEVEKEMKERAPNANNQAFKISKKDLNGDRSFLCIPNENGTYKLYQQNNVIGKGAEGKVELLKDREGNEFVVKVLKTDEGKKGKQENEIALMKEAGLLIHQFVREREKGDKRYVLMPKIPGKDISQILSTVVNDKAVMTEIALKAAESIESLHHLGILHRDVKPANFMVDIQDGKVKGAKAVDFGGAVKIGEDGKVTTNLFGSPKYIAPECDRAKIVPLAQAYGRLLAQPNGGSNNEEQKKELDSQMGVLFGQSKPQGKPVDIYALGIMCQVDFELDLKEMGLEKMLAENPEDRPKIAEVTQKLQSYLQRDRVLENTAQNSDKKTNTNTPEPPQTKPIRRRKFTEPEVPPLRTEKQTEAKAPLHTEKNKAETVKLQSMLKNAFILKQPKVRMSHGQLEFRIAGTSNVKAMQAQLEKANIKFKTLVLGNRTTFVIAPEEIAKRNADELNTIGKEIREDRKRIYAQDHPIPTPPTTPLPGLTDIPPPPNAPLPPVANNSNSAIPQEFNDLVEQVAREQMEDRSIPPPPTVPLPQVPNNSNTVISQEINDLVEQVAREQMEDRSIPPPPTVPLPQVPNIIPPELNDLVDEVAKEQIALEEGQVIPPVPEYEAPRPGDDDEIIPLPPTTPIRSLIMPDDDDSNDAQPPVTQRELEEIDSDENDDINRALDTPRARTNTQYVPVPIAAQNLIETPFGPLGDYYQSTEPLDSNGSKELAKDSQRAHGVLESLGDAGREMLYQGCDEKEQFSDRQAFMKFFEQRLQELQNSPAKKPDLSNKPTTMEKLLGEEGVKLYKKAMEEEGRSKAFRNAVFVKATQHYDGATWDQPKTLVIGGASATGKSFCTGQLVQQIINDTPAIPNQKQEGNDVVSVDGGIERELSQIRQLVLQAALSRGEIGIEDLHSKSKGVSVKHHVQAAAIASGKSIAVPLTFVGQNIPGKKKPKILNQVEGRETIFALVKANKKSVKFNGIKRAWSSAKEALTDIRLNRKVGCESKVYESQYYELGRRGSERAMEEAHKSGLRCYEINNERLTLRNENKGKNLPEKWVVCKPGEVDDIQLSQRSFEAWNKSDRKQGLKEWDDEFKKVNTPVAISQLDPLPVKADKTSAEASSRRSSLKQSGADSEHPHRVSRTDSGRMSSFIDKLRRKSSIQVSKKSISSVSPSPSPIATDILNNPLLRVPSPKESQTPVTAPQTPVTAPQTPVTAPQTPVTAPQTPVTAPQTPVTAPQTKAPDVIQVDQRRGPVRERKVINTESTDPKPQVNSGVLFQYGNSAPQKKTLRELAANRPEQAPTTETTRKNTLK